jgi:hypothetical protein
MNRRKLLSFLPTFGILGTFASAKTEPQVQSFTEHYSPEDPIDQQDRIHIYFFANYDSLKRPEEQSPTSAYSFLQKYWDRRRCDVVAKTYTRALQEALIENAYFGNPKFVQTKIPLYGNW